MEAQLLALLNDYKAAVLQAVALLNDKSVRSPGFQTKRIGFLDDERRVKYAFHGIGCSVTMRSLAVDFDFGHDGRCDGVDAWFLLRYQQDNAAAKAAHPWVEDYEQLRRLLTEAATAGLMVVGLNFAPDSAYDRLFYQLADADNPAPPRWKPSPPPNAPPDWH